MRLWLGAARQQAITWTNVDPVKCRHMASPGHNALSRKVQWCDQIVWPSTRLLPTRSFMLGRKIWDVLEFAPHELYGYYDIIWVSSGELWCARERASTHCGYRAMKLVHHGPLARYVKLQRRETESSGHCFSVILILFWEAIIHIIETCVRWTPWVTLSIHTVLTLNLFGSKLWWSC